MESKKKVKPMVVCLLVLMSLLLVFCCVISVGVTKLQIGELRYQIHLVGENSLTGGVGRGDSRVSRCGRGRRGGGCPTVPSVFGA